MKKNIFLLVPMFILALYSCEKVDDITIGSPENESTLKATNKVEVFKDYNFGGNKASFGVGRYLMRDMENKGMRRDEISSVKVPYGYNISLYDSNNFGGVKCVKANNDTNLGNDDFNDKTASLVVAKTPTWKCICLVIKNFDAPYGTKHYTGTTNSARVQQFVNSARSFPATMKNWSKNQAVVSMDVIVVEESLKSFSSYRDGYWPAPNNTRELLNKYVPNKKYQTIFIALDQGPVPKGGWAGLSLNASSNTKGATYEVLSVTGIGAWVHEWLHGAGSWFRSKYNLDVPDPHDNGQFGYTSEAVNGNWDIWYKALLAGDVLKRNGKNIGYTGVTWRNGGPK